LDFIDYVIDESTPPELIPFIKSYAPHRQCPSRAELLETQYQMWQVTGHCTMKALTLQAGYNYEDEIERIQNAIDEDNEEETP